MVAAFCADDSIVLLRSDRDNSSGTGFAVHRDGNRTWLVTCAHVLDDLGGRENLLVRYQGTDYPVADVPSGAQHGLDLAVFAVDRLALNPLHLHLDGRRSEPIDIRGAQKMGDGYTIERLIGELGDQQPWEVGGPRINIWPLKITGERKLQPGYSGSPVLRPGTNQVLAVTSHKQGEAKGYAIHIGNVTRVWPTLPIDLLRGDNQLAWGLRAELQRLVAETRATWGEDTYDERLRRFAQLALPFTSTFRLPDASPADLVDWLIDLGGDDDWSPVLSYARQVHKSVHDPNLRSRLEVWIDKAAVHLGVTGAWNKPLIYPCREAETDTIPALLVEINEPENSETKRHLTRCFQHLAGRTLRAELDTTKPSLDPRNLDDQTAFATYLNDLLFAYGVDRSKALLGFVLPEALLDLPVEHWAYYDNSDLDHPLGTELPVVVSLAARHHSPEMHEWDQIWRSGWQRQREHHAQTLADTLDWSKTIKHLWSKPKQGRVCIGLQATPCGTDYLTALIESGVTAAIWSRSCADPVGFRAEVNRRFDACRLADLPYAVCRMRNELWGDEIKDGPCYHLTLLWDDITYCLPRVHCGSDDEYLPGVD